MNPNRIVDFQTHPDGPEERKRPPHGDLAAAMEVARTDLSASTGSAPIVVPQTAARLVTKIATASALPPNAVPMSISPPAVRMYQSGTSTTYVNGTATHLPLPVKYNSSAYTSAANGRIDLASTSTSIQAGAPKSTSAVSAPTAKRNSTAAMKMLFDPSRPINGTSTPTSTPIAPSTNGTKHSRAIEPTSKVANSMSPILQHPQAVHMVSFATGSVSASPSVTPSAPSRATGKASGKATSANRAKASSAASSNMTSIAASPVTMTPPHEMVLHSEAGSAASSRGPSPLRSGPPATKIPEPFKVVEEFAALRGTASVGHATIAKPSALGWGSSRSSSSVDSLTVVSSLKRRSLDGACVSKPTGRKHFIGMANLGNTCYINSAIQCLAMASTFTSPLTSMLVSLDDAFRNNGNPHLAGRPTGRGNGSTSRGGSAATTAIAATPVIEEVDKSASTARGTRRRRGSANSSGGASSTAVASASPPSPPQLDKKARSRKSWFKLSDAHNPEDAKFNPLIASLVSILKTLSHPDHLIKMRDGRLAPASMNRLSNASLESTFSSIQGSSSSSSASSSERSRTKHHSNQHGIQQQLITNSEDEEMDVDPIGVDDDEEDTSSATAPSPTSSTTSVTSGDAEFVPSQDVTKVLQAFQNSSGQLLDEKYYTDQHQDISEFILHLLEYAHDQLNTKKPLALPPPQPTPATPKKGRGSKNASSSVPAATVESPRSVAHAAAYPTLSRLEMDCKEWYHYMATNQSPVTNSFDGLLRRSRTCPKGHTATSYEIFRILTLHFEDENAKECTLEDMLRNLRKPEFLECRCSACGGNDDKTFSQVTDVYILPKYLIITLGRFKGAAWGEQSWWAHKIKTRVIFPLDNLDMAPLFDIAVGQPAPKYNLVAISNHKGSSIHGGHYFSYVRSWSNADHWVNLNDTTVKEQRLDALITNQAYMLFYERQDD